MPKPTLRKPARKASRTATASRKGDTAVSSFGHFSALGDTFTITDPLAPPRAQINFLWNDTLISGLNQFGSGEGVFNNQTLTLNHPEGRVRLIADGRRLFYLRDQETGRFWSTGLRPAEGRGAKLRTTVGLGYSEFALRCEGILCESRVTLAPDEPVEIWTFRIRNTTQRKRSLWLAPYVEWLLGGYATFSSPYSYLRSSFDAKLNAVLSCNSSDERPHSRYNAFLATDGHIAQWCGGRRDFLGPFGSPTRPRALEEGQLSCREAWCEELAGAMAIEVALPPGGERSVTVLLGSFDTRSEASRLIRKVMPSAYRAKAAARLAKRNEAVIGCSTVRTPDAQLNRMVNVWGKHQVQLCAEFGRDGARGFRDTLQDAWGIASFNAPLARAKILETLAHQWQDGHAVRGWLPLQKHHYSDGPTWIAPAVTAYVKETGETSFLEARAPYLDQGDDTVLGHLLKGLRWLSGDTGSHGLVLAHEGDWNDSLNWMGRGGKGESVWTSMALFHSLRITSELARDVLKDAGLAAEMDQRAAAMEGAIDKHAWDGKWYLAGYSDAGRPVGSAGNREGRIYLNPQTWGVMTGLAQGDRRKLCLKAIDGILDSEHGSLTLWPPYTGSDEDVGRVTMLLSGMYENGTPYCHGTAFKIVADCCAGRAAEAWASFRKVLPDTAVHPSSVSGCEPYAFTNQYLGPRNGRAGSSISGWITGTAAWMFRAVWEYFLGVRPGYDGFHVCPCLPPEWPVVEAERDLRGVRYRFRFTRTADGTQVEVNGARLTTPFVPYEA
jgi:cellobiose phosphorylase